MILNLPPLQAGPQMTSVGTELKEEFPNSYNSTCFIFLAGYCEGEMK